MIKTQEKDTDIQSFLLMQLENIASQNQMNFFYVVPVHNKNDLTWYI